MQLLQQQSSSPTGQIADQLTLTTTISSSQCEADPSHLASRCHKPDSQLWLNHGPTVPFALLWIPTPFGMIEEGSPTANGGGAVGYNP